MRHVTVLALLALAALCLAGPAGECPPRPGLPPTSSPATLLQALSWRGERGGSPGTSGVNQALSFAGAKPSGVESHRGAGGCRAWWGAMRASPSGAAAMPQTLRPPPSLPFRPTAFVSRREGSEVVRRPRRYLDSGLG